MTGGSFASARNGDALALAAGQLVGAFVQVAVQTKRRQDAAGAVADGFGGERAERAHR